MGQPVWFWIKTAKEEKRRVRLAGLLSFKKLSKVRESGAENVFYF